MFPNNRNNEASAYQPLLECPLPFYNPPEQRLRESSLALVPPHRIYMPPQGLPGPDRIQQVFKTESQRNHHLLCHGYKIDLDELDKQHKIEFEKLLQKQQKQKEYLQVKLRQIEQKQQQSLEKYQGAEGICAKKTEVQQGNQEWILVRRQLAQLPQYHQQERQKYVKEYEKKVEELKMKQGRYDEQLKNCNSTVLQTAVSNTQQQQQKEEEQQPRQQQQQELRQQRQQQQEQQQPQQQQQQQPQQELRQQQQQQQMLLQRQIQLQRLQQMRQLPRN